MKSAFGLLSAAILAMVSVGVIQTEAVVHHPTRFHIVRRHKPDGQVKARDIQDLGAHAFDIGGVGKFIIAIKGYVEPTFHVCLHTNGGPTKFGLVRVEETGKDRNQAAGLYPEPIAFDGQGCAKSAMSLEQFNNSDLVLNLGTNGQHPVGRLHQCSLEECDAIMARPSAK